MVNSIYLLYKPNNSILICFREGSRVLWWPCLCVCLSAIISSEVQAQSSPNYVCVLAVALARSSSGGIGIHYILLVLWMTSCLYVSQEGHSTSPHSWGGSDAALDLAINGAQEYPNPTDARDYFSAGAYWATVGALNIHDNIFAYNVPVCNTKPIWILLKQETVSGSGISWAICKSATRSRQITMPAPHHSVFFTGQMPFLLPNQQRQSTEGTLCILRQENNVCIK